MRRIGLIGGMSWESTAEYYRLLNTLVAERLGGLHSADLLLASVDFAVVEQMQSQGRWDDAVALLVREARVLEAGGAFVPAIIDGGEVVTFRVGDRKTLGVGRGNLEFHVGDVSHIVPKDEIAGLELFDNVLQITRNVSATDGGITTEDVATIKTNEMDDQHAFLKSVEYHLGRTVEAVWSAVA